VWKWGGGGECGDGVGGGGGYVYRVGEEKVMDDFAYPFEWSLYTMYRDYIQKGRGRSDAFIAGCVCGNGGEGGNGVSVKCVNGGKMGVSGWIGAE
jgi:hypothetical protein